MGSYAFPAGQHSQNAHHRAQSISITKIHPLHSFCLVQIWVRRGESRPYYAVGILFPRIGWGVWSVWLSPHFDVFLVQGKPLFWSSFYFQYSSLWCIRSIISWLRIKCSRFWMHFRYLLFTPFQTRYHSLDSVSSSSKPLLVSNDHRDSLQL